MQASEHKDKYNHTGNHFAQCYDGGDMEDMASLAFPIRIWPRVPRFIFSISLSGLQSKKATDKD